MQIQVKPVEEKGEKPLRVSQAPAWQANGHAKDVLFEGQYRRAKAKGECPNTKAAVLIDGKKVLEASSILLILKFVVRRAKMLWSVAIPSDRRVVSFLVAALPRYVSFVLPVRAIA